MYKVDKVTERKHYRVVLLRAAGAEGPLDFMEDAHDEGWTTLTCHMVTDSYRNMEYSWVVFQRRDTK